MCTTSCYFILFKAVVFKFSPSIILLTNSVFKAVFLSLKSREVKFPSTQLEFQPFRPS